MAGIPPKRRVPNTSNSPERRKPTAAKSRKEIFDSERFVRAAIAAAAKKNPAAARLDASTVHSHYRWRPFGEKGSASAAAQAAYDRGLRHITSVLGSKAAYEKFMALLERHRMQSVIDAARGRR